MFRFSEAFVDPQALLAAAEEIAQEGVVSKHADQPYRSGSNPGWIKVKTRAWKAANAARFAYFRERK